jgi:TrpR family transcriptional regulator, trp operon repressor
MKYTHEYGRELERTLFRAAKNKALLHEFLYDLLSPAEYKDLAVRWQIVLLLDQGVTQREIADKLKVSVATVTRGSRELMNKKGGFRQLLKTK